MSDSRWACYVTAPHVGWVVDTCAGGMYSFDVTQAKEWRLRDDVRPELAACELVYTDDKALAVDMGEWEAPIAAYTLVRVK